MEHFQRQFEFLFRSIEWIDKHAGASKYFRLSEDFSINNFFKYQIGCENSLMEL